MVSNAPQPPIRDISPQDAEKLLASEDVDVLDVRTPDEFRDLGHIPGAFNLPVQVFAAGLAKLRERERPILVHCEHGIRSVQACEWLERSGFENVYHLVGGLSRWTGAREFDREDGRATLAPSSWIIRCADLLPDEGKVLDLASGHGRHALLFAAAGFPVVAVDRDEAALARIADVAGNLRLDVRTIRMDLEDGEPDLGDGTYAVAIGIHYLWRPLFPALLRSVRPGGLLLYETFTTAQAAVGKPSNPDFLLEPGELRELVGSFEVLREREGEFEGRHVAAVAARRPTGAPPAAAT